MRRGGKIERGGNGFHGYGGVFQLLKDAFFAFFRHPFIGRNVELPQKHAVERIICVATQLGQLLHIFCLEMVPKNQIFERIFAAGKRRKKERVLRRCLNDAEKIKHSAQYSLQHRRVLHPMRIADVFHKTEKNIEHGMYFQDVGFGVWLQRLFHRLQRVHERDAHRVGNIAKIHEHNRGICPKSATKRCGYGAKHHLSFIQGVFHVHMAFAFAASFQHKDDTMHRIKVFA